jgi:hypothetical protein
MGIMYNEASSILVEAALSDGDPDRVGRADKGELQRRISLKSIYLS